MARLSPCRLWSNVDTPRSDGCLVTGAAVPPMHADDADVGTQRCGCRGEPLCSRRHLTNDVSLLLKRHQDELQICLDRWSAKHEASAEKSLMKLPTPARASKSATEGKVELNRRSAKLSDAGWTDLPSSLPSSPQQVGQPTSGLRDALVSTPTKPQTPPAIVLPPTAISSTRTAGATPTAPRHGGRASGDWQVRSDAEPPTPSKNVLSLTPSVTDVLSLTARNCEQVAELRVAAEAADESSVWITDLETPKSFKMHSRLDRLSDSGSLRRRRDGTGDSAVDGVLTLSPSSNELSLALTKSPLSSPSTRHRQPQSQAEDTPTRPTLRRSGSKEAPRRLHTAWLATSPGEESGQSAEDEELYGQEKHDRWKSLVSGRKKSGKKQLSPLSKRKDAEAKNPWSRLVKHPIYEIMSAFFIMLNAIFIVWETEYRARKGMDIAASAVVEKDFFSKVISDFFSLAFAIDLAFHLLSERDRYFKSREWLWNVFDVAVVTTAVMDSVVQWLPGRSNSSSLQAFLGKFSMLRIVRLLRVIRSSRAIRTSRFIKELRVMVYSLSGAMKSLGWAIVLIIIILSIFGVFFTDGVLGHRSHVHDQDPALAAEIQRYFGTLSGTTVSLYMSMSGGIDWGDLYEMLLPLPVEYRLAFIMFITFAVFALLNVITAVFVESAMQRSQNDRELLVQQELEHKLEFIEEMQRLFEELDLDGGGTLTLDEFEKQIQDENILSYLSSMGLDIDQVRTLLTLLDRDQNGEVDIEEFITGCLRLKGGAKSLDMAVLQYQLEWVVNSVETLNKALQENCPALKDLTAMAPPQIGGNARALPAVSEKE